MMKFGTFSVVNNFPEKKTITIEMKGKAK